MTGGARPAGARELEMVRGSRGWGLEMMGA